MPPARCTSSMWYSGVAGATLHKNGVLRESSSMCDISKSTPASCAAANKCNTVLDEPPMAISTTIEFIKAVLFAIARGSTSWLSFW